MTEDGVHGESKKVVHGRGHARAARGSAGPGRDGAAALRHCSVAGYLNLAPRWNASLTTGNVRDTDVGKSAEVLARIFDPFFTTKGPGKAPASISPRMPPAAGGKAGGDPSARGYGFCASSTFASSTKSFACQSGVSP